MPEEEAAVVKQAIGDAPFLLATSSPRICRVRYDFFQHAGLNPLPAPANQLATIFAALNSESGNSVPGLADAQRSRWV